MAVYTEVTDDDVAAFLREYELGEVVSMKGIAEGVENSNFLLSTTAGTYILTLYEKRVKRADLPFFLGLMEHLADRGIRCPTPIHGRDGRALRELCGRPAAIVTFLQGMWPKRVDVNHCRKLGRAVAEMHAAGRDFPLSRPNDLSVDGWRPLLESCGARADEVEPGLAEELNTELDVLEQAWPRDLPEGVIHADLFPDNVFFHKGEVSGFIDFYFACNDQLAYDLAVCLNAWCFEPSNEFNATKARALLQAYQEVRRFSEAELHALPTLARGAAMRFLLTRLFDWLNHPEGAYVAPKDPREYLRKLRFHREVRGPGAYGLA
jgi:homoserine kinase type II